MSEEQIEFVRYTSCTDCGVADVVGVYSDGHTYCFSCGRLTEPSRKRVVKRRHRRTYQDSVIDRAREAAKADTT